MSSRHVTTPLLAALALAILAVPAQGRSMREHDHGPRVARVQRLLHLHPDGVFGSATVRAVRLFQRHHHLHDDGRVGAQTEAMLRRAAARRPTGHRSTRRRAITHRTHRAHGASQGSVGAVRVLQRHLGMSVDGVFGAGTERRVRHFQSTHGLNADGVVGAATWRALGVRGRHAALHPRSPGSRSGALHSGTPLRVRWAIAAASHIARLPYRYGGGHGSFTDTGYDCSGSVSYVLHAARALAAPLDSGQLAGYGAAGHGRWITIYANGGHVFMTILHHRFDTSGASASGTRWQSQGRSASGYTIRHPPGL